MSRLVGVIGTAVALFAPAVAVAEPPYRVVPAFEKLEFRRPVDLQSPRDGSKRLFVVEQDGVIRVFENRADASASTVYLDIKDRVDRGGNEMGLLGLAFAPDFATSRRFYVDYTASRFTRRVTRIARFRADATGNVPPASEKVLLEIGQPYSNHNGGQVAFGPDGFLYIAMGDGGSGGDPKGNAQSGASLLGKILRIDVSGDDYAIPSDNPFRGNAGWKGEIWAWGLRNPWRFSFDRTTGTLWTGDVGQNAYEEIDIIERGRNYGWDCREGKHAYDADEQTPSCATTDNLVDPVWEYGRDQGMSVTGGYVYRGKALPDLVGWYVYADYVSGNVWALRMHEGRAENRLIAEARILISSFGVDENDELILCAHDPSNGPTKLYKLVPR